MFSVCDNCGVAYDVGRRSCREPDCKRVRKVYKYPRRYKALDRFVSIKSRAKKRGVVFGVTRQTIEGLLQLPCVYCGSDAGIEIDRKDSSKGYVESNLVPACRRCNTIKNNVVSYEEMMFIAKYLGWGWQK